MLWKKCHYSWPVPIYGGNLQKLLVQYKKMKIVKLQAEYASCYCTPNTRWETQFLPSFRQRINSLPRDPEQECLHLLHSLTLDQPSGIPCNSNEEKKGILYLIEWFYTLNLWTQKYLFPSVDSTHAGLIVVYSAYIYIQTGETNLKVEWPD